MPSDSASSPSPRIAHCRLQTHCMCPLVVQPRTHIAAARLPPRATPAAHIQRSIKGQSIWALLPFDVSCTLHPVLDKATISSEPDPSRAPKNRTESYRMRRVASTHTSTPTTTALRTASPENRPESSKQIHPIMKSRTFFGLFFFCFLFSYQPYELLKL